MRRSSDTTQRRVRPGAVAARRGTFTYDGGAGQFPHPVRVHYVLPQGDCADATFLVVMTGSGRNGSEYADDWVATAIRRRVVVLVPEFSKADYPHRWDYNAAGMVTRDGTLRPESAWRFGVVRGAVSVARRQWGVESRAYRLWGHSAGGQFVHRFVMFGSPEHLIHAVAANPVRFTTPDHFAPFPSGLHGAPADSMQVASAFSYPLDIVLGGDDVTPMGLRSGRMPAEETIAESPLQEGLEFFATARQFAAAHGSRFRWSLRVVPGVGHEHTAMAEATKDQLFVDEG